MSLPVVIATVVTNQLTLASKILSFVLDDVVVDGASALPASAAPILLAVTRRNILTELRCVSSGWLKSGELS